MNPPTPYAHIARIIKARKRTGKVVLKPQDSLPFSLSDVLYVGLPVTFTPPDLTGLRTSTITSVDETPQGVSVSFADVDAYDSALSLIGKLLLIRREDLHVDLSDLGSDLVDDPFLDDTDESFEASETPFDAYDHLGRTVIDATHDTLGTIEDVFTTPAHDIWTVSGPYGDVLIPVLEEFVVDVPDDRSEPISVELIEGFVSS